MPDYLLIALVSMICSLVIAALSLPLLLHKVPMNRFYGVRFRAAFLSQRNWYEINEHGGRLLLLASLAVFLTGLYGVIGSPGNLRVYMWINVSVILIAYGTVSFTTFLRARSLPTDAG